jgi:co-chaperonin GroES (HSP10)
MTKTAELGKKVEKPLRMPEAKPSGNKIMVQLAAVESFSIGGIFLPPSQAERDSMNQTEGRVVALGPLAYGDMRRWDTETQTWKQTNWVDVGMRVAFQRHHGWVYVEGEGEDKTEYRILHDTDLTMVYPKEDSHE